jgi:hypothetical protein
MSRRLKKLGAMQEELKDVYVKQIRSVLESHSLKEQTLKGSKSLTSILYWV